MREKDLDKTPTLNTLQAKRQRTRTVNKLNETSSRILFVLGVSVAAQVHRRGCRRWHRRHPTPHARAVHQHSAHKECCPSRVLARLDVCVLAKTIRRQLFLNILMHIAAARPRPTAKIVVPLSPQIALPSPTRAPVPTFPTPVPPQSDLLACGDRPRSF